MSPSATVERSTRSVFLRTPSENPGTRDFPRDGASGTFRRPDSGVSSFGPFIPSDFAIFGGLKQKSNLFASELPYQSDADSRIFQFHDEFRKASGTNDLDPFSELFGRDFSERSEDFRLHFASRFRVARNRKFGIRDRFFRNEGGEKFDRGVLRFDLRRIHLFSPNDDFARSLVEQYSVFGPFGYFGKVTDSEISEIVAVCVAASVPHFRSDFPLEEVLAYARPLGSVSVEKVRVFDARLRIVFAYLADGPFQSGPSGLRLRNENESPSGFSAVKGKEADIGPERERRPSERLAEAFGEIPLVDGRRKGIADLVERFYEPVGHVFPVSSVPEFRQAAGRFDRECRDRFGKRGRESARTGEPSEHRIRFLANSEFFAKEFRKTFESGGIRAFIGFDGFRIGSESRKYDSAVERQAFGVERAVSAGFLKKEPTVFFIPVLVFLADSREEEASRFESGRAVDSERAVVPEELGNRKRERKRGFGPSDFFARFSGEFEKRGRKRGRERS